MKLQHLFMPARFGSVELANRFVMAPLTRCRAPGHIPSDLMAQYYAQRAGAGLIIAEATMVIEGNSAFVAEPGIYSQEQVAAWRRVTAAVHRAGGRIFLQLWHGGRACHPLANGGRQPVSSSAIAIVGSKFHTPSGPQPYATPRPLEDGEIPQVVAGFAQAAHNARSADFDGVEIHAANGYLIDQFLRDSANHRIGPYGGCLANRSRLLMEIAHAVCDAWEPGRVGVRISPINSYNDMRDSDPIGLATHVAQQLSPLGLAYLHVMRSDFFGVQTGDVISPVRSAFKGPLIANMGYTPEEADMSIAKREVDAVAFGKPFIANPDFPTRVLLGAPFNEARPESFYSGAADGYTDYPVLGQAGTVSPS